MTVARAGAAASTRRPASLAGGLLLAVLAGTASVRADVVHEPGQDAKAWAAYLEYALTGSPEALDRLAALQGETSFIAFEQAMQAGRRGDRVRMLERADRATELDPDNGEAHALLARVLFRLADEAMPALETLARAIGHADNAIRLDAADPEIFDRLAAAHGFLAARAERSGDADTALRERGLQKNALESWAEKLHHDVAWQQLADLSRELGDKPGEARALEENIRRGDDVLLASQRLADVLAELGRCEAALPVLEAALDVAAEDKYAGITLAVQLGDCATRASEPVLAETACRRALELDPTNLLAVSGLAEAQWMQGRREEAVATLNSGGVRLGDDGAERSGAEERLDWLATRARWKGAHGLPDALDDAQKAVALAESTGTPRQKALMSALLAEARVGAGDVPGAIEAARTAVARDSGHEASVVTLLNALWMDGDRKVVAREIEALEKGKDSSWLARVARWEAARGFDEAARRHARRALEGFSGAPGARAELQVEVGEALLGAGDAVQAEIVARDAVRIRPWDEEAAFLLADALVAQGRGDEADASLTELDGRRGEDPWLLERRAEFEMGRRRPEAALAFATSALQSVGGGAHPAERARLMAVQGAALLEAGKTSEAVARLEACVALSRFPPPSRVLALAQALEKAGRTADALAVVEPAARRLPDEDGLQLSWGRLLVLSGRSDEGTAILLGLLGDKRILPGRYGQVALVLEEGKLADKALEVALQGVERFPRHAAAQMTAARILEKAGRRDDAEARLRRALEIDPDSPLVLNSLGYSLAEWGVHLEESVKLLRRAVQLRPHEAAYLDSLGWALVKSGRSDEAVKWLEAAVARDRDPVILAHLAAVRVTEGRKDEAIALYEESLAGGLDENVEAVRAALARLKAAPEGP